MDVGTSATASPPLDERAVRRLHWRCRRGLLENDLFITSFFERYGAALTERHARGLDALMDLADNDLLDLLLRRKLPQAGLATPEVLEVLALLHSAGGAPQRH
ncbi:FAD assembly factor SdhE [Xylophilus sp.]|uniref:FAD assembly factor SdhE n=1 Tax=Xylophilus sp. TaxID=2653893 RepID=UPI0013BD3524|nr:succinate dehydrogenase assembly factor 2 [Xylophilus sp.]KAF1046831.1 MAG: FAD assembly factor SdhE [Xylophilus sp.]